jgi:hypothetical protein
VIRILKPIPKEVVREKTVDEMAQYTRGIMLKAMTEYNDHCTTEVLAEKLYTPTMWGVFIGMYVQQYLEIKVFLWICRTV